MTNISPYEFELPNGPINAPAGIYVSPVYEPDFLETLDMYPEADDSEGSDDPYTLMQMQDNTGQYTVNGDPWTVVTDNDVIADIEAFLDRNPSSASCEDVQQLDFTAPFRIRGRRTNGFGGRSKTHRTAPKRTTEKTHPVLIARDQAKARLQEAIDDIPREWPVWDGKARDYTMVPRPIAEIEHDIAYETRAVNVDGVTAEALREQPYAQGFATRPTQAELKEALLALRKHNTRR